MWLVNLIVISRIKGCDILLGVNVEDPQYDSYATKYKGVMGKFK